MLPFFQFSYPKEQRSKPHIVQNKLSLSLSCSTSKWISGNETISKTIESRKVVAYFFQSHIKLLTKWAHFFFLSFAMSFSLSTSFRQINYENGANISQTRQKIQRENRSFFLSSCRGVCALNLFSIFSYEFRTFVTLNDWFIEWIWSLLWNTARLFLINSCTHKFKSCEPVCRPDGFILYFHSIRSVHSLLSTLHLLVIVYNVTFVKSNTFVSMIIALTFSCQIIRQKSLTISSVGPCVTI